MKKVNFDNNKFIKFFSGKAFYVSLCACVAVVGAAGYVTYRETTEKLKNQLQIDHVVEEGTTVRSYTYEDFTQANAKEEDIPKETTAEETTTAPPETAAVIVDTVIAVQDPYVYPINNEVVNPFSSGELVKSKTLNCWKTHDGVDIKAELGTQVCAMTSGKVISVYEDALWGVCIVIDHGNGIEGHYCGLAKGVTVKPDQKVTTGMVIGAVGNTAECEIAEVSHLHFGVKQNGNWIEPISLIRANM